MYACLAYIGALMKDGGIKAGLPENDADTDVVELHRKSDHDILGIIFSGQYWSSIHIDNKARGLLVAQIYIHTLFSYNIFLR